MMVTVDRDTPKIGHIITRRDHTNRVTVWREGGMEASRPCIWPDTDTLGAWSKYGASIASYSYGIMIERPDRGRRG